MTGRVVYQRVTEFVFHVSAAALADNGAGVAPYYRALSDGLRERGHDVDFIRHDRPTTLQTVSEDRAIHILDHGQITHPRVWNTGVAYIYPFWNVDRRGIRAQSLIGAMRYEPDSIDPEVARPFFQRMRRRLVGGRKSRYSQMEVRTDIPEGCVAVFLQSDAHRGLSETCYMTTRDMVRAVIDGAGDTPVVIKPHPLEQCEDLDAFLKDCALWHPNVTITTANIHDILAVADVTVTINSAVGLESMLHFTPVVLCGGADFHHACVTVTTPEDIWDGIARATRRKWTFPKYIYWYFGIQCLSAGSATLVDDFLERINSDVPEEL